MKIIIIVLQFLFISNYAATYTLGEYSGKIINRTNFNISNVFVEVHIEVHNGNPFSSGGTLLAENRTNYTFQFNENNEAAIDIPKSTLNESSHSFWKKDFKATVVFKINDINFIKAFNFYNENFGDKFINLSLDQITALYVLPQQLNIKLNVKNPNDPSLNHPWGIFNNLTLNLWARFNNENDPKLINLKTKDFYEYTNRYYFSYPKNTGYENGFFTYNFLLNSGFSFNKQPIIIIANEDFGQNPQMTFDIAVVVSRKDYSNQEMFNKSLVFGLNEPLPSELLNIITN